MWPDIHTWVMVFTAALITIQKVTEARALKSNREAEKEVCGKRLTSEIKGVCGPGNYNSIEGQLDSSAQELHENIVQKCCWRPCAYTELRKYCGGPRTFVKVEGTTESEQTQSDRSLRPRRGGKSKNEIPTWKRSDQKKNSTSFLKKFVENKGQKNLCKRTTRIKHQHKRHESSALETAIESSQFAPVILFPIGWVVREKSGSGLEQTRSQRHVFPNQPSGGDLINPPGGKGGQFRKPIKYSYSFPHKIFDQLPVNSDETMENERIAEMSDFGNIILENTTLKLSTTSGGHQATEGPVPRSFILGDIANEYSFSG